MSEAQDPADQMLTPAQAAAMFGVTVKTMTRWANRGQITHIRTPGGQRRYRRGDLEAFLGPR